MIKKETRLKREKKMESKIKLEEVQACLAAMNNFFVDKNISMTGDEALLYANIIKECHRLCKLIDEELKEESDESEKK